MRDERFVTIIFKQIWLNKIKNLYATPCDPGCIKDELFMIIADKNKNACNKIVWRIKLYFKSTNIITSACWRTVLKCHRTLIQAAELYLQRVSHLKVIHPCEYFQIRTRSIAMQQFPGYSFTILNQRVQLTTAAPVAILFFAALPMDQGSSLSSVSV